MKTVIVGGGLMGLCTAMLLADDGHEVTVLERDGRLPPDPRQAFESWERRGVNQFRLAHFFLSGFRRIVETELPRLRQELAEAGALTYNVLDGIPDELKGGTRADDDRFDVITGRRPVVEAATARRCGETKDVTVRRGTPVQGLVLGSSDREGVPHVAGVRLESGDEVRCDLVIDAAGRRSALPRWLAEVGAAPVVEESDDSGFVYFGRHFRSVDGRMPVLLGPLKQDVGTIGVLTLPADNGTWSVTLTASSKDVALRALRDAETWERVNRLLPLTAHWLDAEPIDDGVTMMAKIEDRIRTFAPGGRPVATGVVAVADSWSCTNPSLGRGATVGMMHAVALRDHLRDPADPWTLATRWHERTAETVEPWYRTTRAYDRHRLQEIHALIEGRPYETEDEFWLLNRALDASSSRHGDNLRAALEMAMALRRPDEVLGDPILRERVLGGGKIADAPATGPDRGELLAAVNG